MNPTVIWLPHTNTELLYIHIANLTCNQLCIISRKKSTHFPSVLPKPWNLPEPKKNQTVKPTTCLRLLPTLTWECKFWGSLVEEVTSVGWLISNSHIFKRACSATDTMYHVLVHSRKSHMRNCPFRFYDYKYFESSTFFRLSRSLHTYDASKQLQNAQRTH